jgi:hypothetical protein
MSLAITVCLKPLKHVCITPIDTFAAMFFNLRVEPTSNETCVGFSMQTMVLFVTKKSFYPLQNIDQF